MRHFVLVLSGLLIGACVAPDGKSAPYGAMFSGDEALKTVFGEVCMPAILDGKSIAELAKGRGMVETPSRGVNAGADDHEYTLATLGGASVTAWADGSCMSSVQNGDPAAYAAYVVEAITARGVTLTQGQTNPASNGGANTAWCSAGPQPIVLGIISPTAGGKRAAIVANLFRAKGLAPSFCKPA